MDEETKTPIEQQEQPVQPEPPTEQPKPETSGSGEIKVLTEKVETLTNIITEFIKTSQAPKVEIEQDEPEPENDGISDEDIEKADDLLDW